MPWTDALLRFQEIDLELQNMNQRLNTIETTLHDESELAKAQKEAEQLAQTARVAEKTQKDLEFELGRVQTDLRQTDERLYGGTVTNARQLEDLQAKSQSLRRRAAKLEDDLLEAMVGREEAVEEATTVAAHLKTITEERETLCHNLGIERAELQERGNSLLKEVQHVKEKIPPAILDSYHYLASRTGGVPVARLQGDTCNMCGVEVLKPTQRKIKSGEEAYCDGCRRMIVA